MLAGDLDQTSTVLRFYYIDSPPPLTVGLFFIHNHSDGTYSGIIEIAEMTLMCSGNTSYDVSSSASALSLQS